MNYRRTPTGCAWLNDDGSIATTEEVARHMQTHTVTREAEEVVVCPMCGKEAKYVSEHEKGFMYKCCCVNFILSKEYVEG